MIKNGKPDYEDVYMINLIYHSNIPFDHPVLGKLSKLTPFYTWAIDPATFDYDQFKSEWLLALDQKLCYSNSALFRKSVSTYLKS